jgi:hypothetical protein
VPDGGLPRDFAAHRVAENVGVCESQVLDQGGDVVRHLLVAKRAINVGCMPMGLQLNGDDLAGRGKGWQKQCEHADYAKATVKGRPVP